MLAKPSGMVARKKESSQWFDGLSTDQPVNAWVVLPHSAQLKHHTFQTAWLV